jgi:hypothetical protein
MNESYFYSNFSCSLLTRVYVELAIGSAKKNLFISFLGLGIVVGETWLDIKLDACGANSVCLTLSRCFPLPSVAFITVKNCLHKCTGPWSEEEQQKLCELVLKCLHVKAQMAKKGLTTKDHRIVRILLLFISQSFRGHCQYQDFLESLLRIYIF